jgi:hypothetical protein
MPRLTREKHGKKKTAQEVEFIAVQKGLTTKLVPVPVQRDRTPSPLRSRFKKSQASSYMPQPHSLLKTLQRPAVIIKTQGSSGKVSSFLNFLMRTFINMLYSHRMAFSESG